VFTQNPAYIPPRGEGVQPRWKVDVQPDGSLSPAGRVMVVSTIPHEQVHAYQARAGARLPRWVAEGHATWIGDKIAALLDPAIAQTQHQLRIDDAAKGKGPLNLAQWGSRRPKREAVLRQVSPEDRARMEADPTFNRQERSRSNQKISKMLLRIHRDSTLPPRLFSVAWRHATVLGRFAHG